MIEGTYRIAMKTPMGKKNGELTLHKVENSISGMLTIAGHRIAIKDGTVSENICSFSGEFHMPMGDISFTASGEINEHTLSFLIQTSKGDMTITGERTE